MIVSFGYTSLQIEHDLTRFIQLSHNSGFLSVTDWAQNSVLQFKQEPNVVHLSHNVYPLLIITGFKDFKLWQLILLHLLNI
ncbi:MAG: hypothetical protein Barrevirus39_3 [Barrevirus sp.]|uniref:Uncharacterized protein n=1 Tax=Barrevirus sp. TaxID=2487763 RepID=A0A3G4ZR40_9VIRU|nr:MAG: hypothetical protein Barrevirus39_3 [Barrevirus sp.]